MLDPNGHTLAISTLQPTTLSCSSETRSTTSRPSVMLTRCPRASMVLSFCIKTRKGIVLLLVSGKFSVPPKQVNTFSDQELVVSVPLEPSEPTSRLASCLRRVQSVRQKDCRLMVIVKKMNLLYQKVRQTRHFGRPWSVSTSDRASLIFCLSTSVMQLQRCILISM